MVGPHIPELPLGLQQGVWAIALCAAVHIQADLFMMPFQHASCASPHLMFVHLPQLLVPACLAWMASRWY